MISSILPAVNNLSTFSKQNLTETKGNEIYGRQIYTEAGKILKSFKGATKGSGQNRGDEQRKLK